MTDATTPYLNLPLRTEAQARTDRAAGTDSRMTDDYLEPLPHGPMTVAELMDALAGERRRVGPDAEVYIWQQEDCEPSDLVPVNVFSRHNFIVIEAREK